jgi:outer membrane protein OmpA-like peptidoglycan-associated protein/Tol biopolymer transport system component
MKLRFLALLLLAASSALAQPGGRKSEQKNTLKIAKEHLRFEEYQLALPHVKALVEQDPGSAYYNFWMGKCLYISYKKNQALPFLEKVEKINPDVDKEFNYWYGLTLHYNLHFDRAIAAYRKDLERYAPGTAEYTLVNNRISQCTYAKKLSKKKEAEQVKIANMGAKINSAFSEHSPVISANDTVLLYTARRPESLGANPATHFYDEDIYVSYNRNGSWTEGVNIDRPVNASGHDATISLSADGKNLYLYRHKKAGGLYVTKFNETKRQWDEPRAVQRPLNSKYYEASICQSADSSMLFFTSDRPNGFGGRDIYMVKSTGKNSWSEPINLGPTVNTPFDEDAPYFHPDGKTLYYSSNGPSSIGGFDIFVTEMTSDSATGWLTPLNMGAPVNTPDDDIYFVLSGTGKSGYYSSGMEGGLGEKDIYNIQFPYYPYPRRYHVVELAGLIQDVNTLDTLKAWVKLVDIATDKVLDSVYTGSDSARYYFILEPERSYSLSVQADGYFPTSERLITPRLSDEDIFLVKNMFLDKPVAKVPPAPTPAIPDFQNIYYDFDKDFIRDDAAAELDRLVDFLLANPACKVEVLSHTDWFGTYSYNVDLSLRRAKNAKRYLIDHGVQASRVSTGHFSENQPLDSNTDDTGRQYNRRSEFRVYQDQKLLLATKKLRNGVQAVRVDHTTPKGEAGFDNPQESVSTAATSPGTQNDDMPVQIPTGKDALKDDAPPTGKDALKDATPPTGKDALKNPIDAPVAVEADVMAAVKGLDLHHIYFDFDKSDLRSLSNEQLERVLGVLKQYKDLRIEVYGHTDAKGSVTYNQALSSRRATAAYDYLTRQGADNVEIVLRAESELQPIDSNDSATGRQNNRRVEFTILYKGQVLVKSQP